jgi:hypothetical protein
MLRGLCGYRRRQTNAYSRSATLDKRIELFQHYVTDVTREGASTVYL